MLRKNFDRVLKKDLDGKVNSFFCFVNDQRINPLILSRVMYRNDECVGSEECWGKEIYTGKRARVRKCLEKTAGCSVCNLLRNYGSTRMEGTSLEHEEMTRDRDGCKNR